MLACSANYAKQTHVWAFAKKKKKTRKSSQQYKTCSLGKMGRQWLRRRWRRWLRRRESRRHAGVNAMRIDEQQQDKLQRERAEWGADVLSSILLIHANCFVVVITYCAYLIWLKINVYLFIYFSFSNFFLMFRSLLRLLGYYLYRY